MRYPAIDKHGFHPAIAPNMPDYEATCRTFSWEQVRAQLSGLPAGGLNIAFEAVGRHLAAGRGDHPAIRWIGKDDSVRNYSYRDLEIATNRFANVLASLGVEPGQRVFSLAGRIPELYFAALGTLKYRAVFCPLFAAFGPDPVRQRMTRGNGRVLVTTAHLYNACRYRKSFAVCLPAQT